MDDTFKTLKENTEGLFKDKGSKFFAYGYPISKEEQVKDLVQQLKKEHHSARHHCYAFKIGIENVQFRANDDGEPSGTAGKPILGQIESNDLTNILIVVVRYFGGILLGTGGLINAYRNAAADCIANAKIDTRIIENELSVSFSYEQLNTAMRVVKEEDLRVVEQNFLESCEMKIAVKQSQYESVFNKFDSIYGIEVEKV